MTTYPYNQFYNYPVRYFTTGAFEFDFSYIHHLYLYEKESGPIVGDTGIEGLRLDFRAGLRLEVPAGDFHIQIADSDSGQIFLDEDLAEITLISAEKYAINWEVKVWERGCLVFSYALDLHGETVYFFLAGEAIGDTIGMLEYIAEFSRFYGAKVVLKTPPLFLDIVQSYYPELTVATVPTDDIYIAYCLGVFELPPYTAPIDARRLTHDAMAMSLLNLPTRAEHRLYTPTVPRTIAEKYCCIAVQASGFCKRWHYPKGWDIVVAELRRQGYRVFCIDGEATAEYHGYEHYQVRVPAGAEDLTGRLPLMERVNLLAYADFFIGLGSGMSWLAWACGVPVVLISGFSLTLGEFYTPYRVTNRLLCHGCFNDITVNWKEECPKFKHTAREFECSKKITPKMVLSAVKRAIADREQSLC